MRQTAHFPPAADHNPENQLLALSL